MHFLAGGFPKGVFGGVFETDGHGFLQRGDGRVADPGVGGGDVGDEFGGADQPADAPARGVEVLAAGPDGEGAGGDFRGEGPDAGEGGVVESVVDLVREDEDVVFDGQVADGLEFFAGEDFADGVVGGVEDYDFCFLGGDGLGEEGWVEDPFGGGGAGLVGVGWGRQRHVFDGCAGHLDVGNVSI